MLTLASVAFAPLEGFATLPVTGAVVNMALPIGGGILLVLGISAIVFAQLRKRKLATALHAEEPEATEA